MQKQSSNHTGGSPARDRIVERECEAETAGKLTARDLEISAWLGRLPGASAVQIRRRFGIGRAQGYRRLQVLRSFGLVRQVQVLAWRPALYMVSGRSLRPGSYEHALALAELVVTREAAGSVIASDVELRRYRRGQGTLIEMLELEDLDVIVECPRVPDAVEWMGDGGLRAYEIELSSKGRTRREEILSAYAISSYRTVTWLVPDARLAELIDGEIERMGIGGFIEVARE